MHENVVVLLSGGQDSTTCLFWALSHVKARRVTAVSCWYGQRHEVELEAARDVVRCARAAYPSAVIDHEEVRLGEVLRGTSPLVSSAPLGQYDSVESLPGGVEPTFVPGRNLLFLTIAANRAEVAGATAIITGVSQEDYGGYFDCREEFLVAGARALGQALAGKDHHLAILAPLLNLNKEETVILSERLRGCRAALTYSHTCYAGTFPPCGPGGRGGYAA